MSCSHEILGGLGSLHDGMEAPRGGRAASLCLTKSANDLPGLAIRRIKARAEKVFSLKGRSLGAQEPKI